MLGERVQMLSAGRMERAKLLLLDICDYGQTSLSASKSVKSTAKLSVCSKDNRTFKRHPLLAGSLLRKNEQRLLQERIKVSQCKLPASLPDELAFFLLPPLGRQNIRRGT